MKASIVIFCVKQVQAKLERICETAQKHLITKEPLLILVPDLQSLNYVDTLLWKCTPQTFLPHPSKYINISLEPQEASALFNLKSSFFVEDNSFHYKVIYELEDHTSSEKLQLSKDRYREYREKNYPISFN